MSHSEPGQKVIDLLKSHCSIRRFKDQPIADELLTDLLAGGQSASTSSFIQATSVIRITQPELRATLAKLAGEQPYVETAAEFLVFCADFYRHQQCIAKLAENAEFDWAEQLLTATVDVALFAQNVVVAAEANGLGGCYIGGIRNNIAEVTELLALPEQVYPVFGLCLGYADQTPAHKPRLPLSAIVFNDRYAPDKSAAIDDYDTLISEYYRQRSKGRLTQSWTQQIAKQAKTQHRPFILSFLQSRGWIRR